MGFQYREDAERVYEVLPKRFARYQLAIHPRKSRLVDFSCPHQEDGKGKGTFEFLGFTHYWSRTRRGAWTIKRKTRPKRLKRTMQAFWTWCRDNRHEPLTEQYQELCQKLCGHYQYFGVRSNYKMLEVVYEWAEHSWRYWLNRRSSKRKVTWEMFDRKIRPLFPLPKPRIVHTF
jgi:RNA-directed DNA polymerase